jgi:hypothetical protein
MIFKNRLLLGFVCAIGVGGAAYWITQSRSPGFCWGACDEARKTEFISVSYSWMQSIAYCQKTEAADAALEELFPELAQTVRSHSAEYAGLAEKEKIGTLTLMERQVYLDSPYRVPEPFDPLWAIRDTAAVDQPLIQPCHQTGFHTGKRSYELEGYCYGYAAVEYPYSEGESIWKEKLNEAYKQMKSQGNVEKFIARVTLEVQRHQVALHDADRAVEDMPASSFSTDDPVMMQFEIESAKRTAACQE